jgi:O-Antigen ligase
MWNFYYNTFWRMDWGFGNPNKTAALISMLMVALWILAYTRKEVFWFCLVAFTALGLCLTDTFSRGGIVALLCGVAPLICTLKRPWPLSRIIGIAVAVCTIFGSTLYLGLEKRFEGGIVVKDDSVGHRLEIWRAAPQMMFDAPYGWGIGKSGDAYSQWYQPIERSEKYRTLVNSHLTFLVEVSWPLRLLYIAGWAVIAWLCWPTPKMRVLSIALGIWTSFFIAAAFSSVEESPTLWILPVSALVAVIAWRIYEHEWTRFKPLLLTSVALIGFTFVWLALTTRKSDVYVDNGVISLGKGDPSTWLVIDKKVMGANYGHTLRRFLTDHPDGAIAIADPSSKLPSFAGKTVVFAGSVPDVQPEIISSVRRVIVLNPTRFPQETGLAAINASIVTVYFGQFCTSPSIGSWSDIYPIRTITGVGDFVPNWPNLVL